MKSYYNFINMSKTSHDNSLTIFFFHEQGCQNEIITHRTVLFTYSNIYMQQHFIIKCNHLSFDFTLLYISYEIQRKDESQHNDLFILKGCLYEFRKCLTPLNLPIALYNNKLVIFNNKIPVTISVHSITYYVIHTFTSSTNTNFPTK